MLHHKFPPDLLDPCCSVCGGAQGAFLVREWGALGGRFNPLLHVCSAEKKGGGGEGD